MTRSAAVARAEREIVRLCHSGLDVTRLQDQVLRSLRRVMPVDAAFFATADPDTLLFTGVRTEEPLDGATSMFLTNEFSADDVNKFSTLAASAVHVATLDSATRGDRSSSLRSRAILEPLGLGDELRAALVTGSQCWGYLCLHRDNRPLGFTAGEAATIARLGPHIAAALRTAVLFHPRGNGDLAGPGVVLLAEDLTVVAITEQAEHDLDLIPDRHPSHLPLPAAVYTVAAALLAVEAGTAAAGLVPSARVQTVEGRWVHLHASRLRAAQGEGRITVVVQPVDAPAIAPLMLAAYGLSARETEIALLVLHGGSTRLISNTLHISAHTVQDHLKSVFAKTGVSSRGELVGHFLTTPAHPQPPP
jgi:DNA-binding CsgD family transcriptional regulator